MTHETSFNLSGLKKISQLKIISHCSYCAIRYEHLITISTHFSLFLTSTLLGIMRIHKSYFRVFDYRFQGVEALTILA